MNFKKLIFGFTFFLIGLSSFGQQPDWLTFYEKSGMLETPRYDATMQYIKQLDVFSKQINTFTFGISPEGRELIALVYDKDGLTNPDAIRDKGRVVLLVEACIHSGESEGKDAMLMLLRDVVANKQHTQLFEDVSLLFIPIFNVDGHERFSAYSRINQNGPKEMGWRTTAQNLNLNRDFLKADAPEMQAWLRLFNQWNPDFFIDTHTTDGADYQYAITYALETEGQANEGLKQWQKKIFVPVVEQKMEQRGFPLFPYVSFKSWHDPRSGLISGAASPIYSQGYTSTRNRPGMLVETHMLKPYHLRVEATYNIILSTLEILNAQNDELKVLIKKADQFTASSEFRKNPFPLRFTVDLTDSVMVPFKGVAYEIRKSDLTGGDWFIYNNEQPEEFLLPFFSKNKAVTQVMLPEAYVIPVVWQDILQRMQLHGIEMFPLEKGQNIRCENYRFTKFEWQRSPYEGHHRLSKMEYDTFDSSRFFPAGSMVVPMNQPLAGLIAYLLEPKAEGSLLEWGYFNGIFEQKEYAETYVMEPIARKMLDTVAGLREAYEIKKETDKAFAENQWLQMNWFYRQTPWWDQNYLLYPVGRITLSNEVPEGNSKATRL